MTFVYNIILVVVFSRYGALGNVAGEVYQPSGDATIVDESVSPNNTIPDAPTPTFLPEVEFLDRFCRKVTKNVVSSFQNPSYPSNETYPIICQHVVMPEDGYCALRIEFHDTIFAPRGEGCATDIFQIINSLDTPAVAQCGLLEGYQFTVRVTAGRLVTLLVTSQSETKWNIIVTQIPCQNINAVADLLPKECGKAGDPAEDLRKNSEQISLVEPVELLKEDRKPEWPYIGLRGPEELLRKAVLNFKANLRIVNGNETGTNEYPWQVLILANGKPLCGGSLISDQFVLTAGHCTTVSARVPLASLLIVDLGDHDLTSAKESPNKVYRVAKIIPHIQHEIVLDDLALLKLQKKVEFNKAISPICLPPHTTPEKTYEGQTAYTSGWGKTGDASVISPVLRKAEMEVISLELCRELWDLVGPNGGEIIQDSMICAGGGDTGPCNGDSGGPLIVKDESEEQYNLIGITSFGSLRGCALQGVPTVFTRVSSFVDWIHLNMAEP